MKKLTILALALLVFASLPVWSQSAADRYVDYSKPAFDAASDKVRVLFFHAAWCPFCKTADVNFKNNSAGIPENVVIFKTDYDSEKTLKRNYGITYQHTFVQVDGKGNMVTKWSGGDVEKLVQSIKVK